ncbi:MAG: MCE family protein [Nitrosomonadales bacterium]|jgi:paraquat-inducible protein B|nr:MCE family protein [Nitrosomonadales bacterium]MBT4183579.1 MCE family protein [Nitrosomonadales bacterium]MBT4570818.1 MCE family protein [Nitrosomonadales bacterium]MBT4759091.1 MCE family protein [Nitrosomonadales bacterium]MBT5572828.1 MCE family protein [Nitrosomonadales bacterium]
MSKPVNPTLIGSFFLAAIGLVIVSILMFSRGNFFEKHHQFVLFFHAENNLNGLNVGAPVKLEGVKIGEVKEVALLFDEKTREVVKPVVIELDYSNVISDDDLDDDFVAKEEGEQNESIKSLIKKGLKAQLKTQSLLTGLLYIEFQFTPQDEIVLSGRNFRDLRELPTTTNATEDLKRQAQEVVDKIGKLPLEQIVEDLAVNMQEIKEILTSQSLKENRQGVNQSIKEMEKLLINLNKNFTPLMFNLNGTVKDTRVVVQEFSRDIKPVLSSLEKTLNKATEILSESQYAVRSFEELSSPEAPLWQALEALKDAAESTKNLTDTLERHPESIIYGKGEE